MPGLKENYTFAGRHSFGLFRHIDFYYSPVCSSSWAVLYKGTAKYFSSLKGCLDFARMKGWVKDENMPALFKNLAEHERQEDGRWFSGRKAETPEKSAFPFRESR